ncbi:uncharacterized protein LOC100917678 [Sarcophilus harrisii]|uniref:uncharacterized protein LOC100917678 n=1 Tax=Sarcophilus harrisii TaxID=9305 RepID=UPI000273AA88|nr:uncharacterized protein LOC100917678 [Sarcophilus harrisii]
MQPQGTSYGFIVIQLCLTLCDPLDRLSMRRSNVLSIPTPYLQSPNRGAGRGDITTAPRTTPASNFILRIPGLTLALIIQIEQGTEPWVLGHLDPKETDTMADLFGGKMKNKIHRRRHKPEVKHKRSEKNVLQNPKNTQILTEPEEKTDYSQSQKNMGPPKEAIVQGDQSQLDPYIQTTKWTSVNIIAAEMAEKRHLADEVAQGSFSPMQRYLDRLNSNVENLLQVVQDSFVQQQKVMSVLDDMASELHEEVEFLKVKWGV